MLNSTFWRVITFGFQLADFFNQTQYCIFEAVAIGSLGFEAFKDGSVLCLLVNFVFFLWYNCIVIFYQFKVSDNFGNVNFGTLGLAFVLIVGDGVDVKCSTSLFLAAILINFKVNVCCLPISSKFWFQGEYVYHIVVTCVPPNNTPAMWQQWFRFRFRHIVEKLLVLSKLVSLIGCKTARHFLWVLIFL